MNSENPTHYITTRQVQDRFASEIAAIRGHKLTPREISDYAASLTKVIAKKKSKKGLVPIKSIVFDLSEKIPALRDRLADLELTLNDMLDYLQHDPNRLEGVPETLAAKIRRGTELVFDLKDPVVPIHERLDIKTRRDAFLYALTCRNILSYALETIDAYRRYALLVKQKKLKHESYTEKDGIFRKAILRMPPKLVLLRLAAYDAGGTRAARAEAPQPVQTARTESVKPARTPVDPRTIAARLIALRAKNLET